MAPITPTARSTAVEDAIAGYEALMASLADSHTPEFLEIAVTMPQAKVLYLLGASAAELHMAEVVARLGVSLSTVSGLVDRIVDHGLATRREDPADRRQVLVGLTTAGREFVDRFRELNARQMRTLLEHLDDAELEQVRSALGVLARAATRIPASSPTVPATAPAAGAHAPRATARKDPA